MDGYWIHGWMNRWRDVQISLKFPKGDSDRQTKDAKGSDKGRCLSLDLYITQVSGDVCTRV